MASLRATGPEFLAERFMAESPLAHCARIGSASGPDGASWPEAVIAVSLAPWRELKARLDDASRFLATARAELGRLRSQYGATHLALELPIHRPHSAAPEVLALDSATLALLGELGIALRASLIAPDFAGAAERHPRIIVHPQVCGGHPAIRGTRVLVRNLVDALARGQTLWQIQQDFPDIGPEDLAAAVAFIAEQAEHA